MEHLTQEQIRLLMELVVKEYEFIRTSLVDLSPEDRANESHRFNDLIDLRRTLEQL